MIQQSPEYQLINRLDDACVKYKLCIYVGIYIVITSFQIYTLHEMQHLAIALYKEHLQTCTLLCIKNYCALLY